MAADNQPLLTEKLPEFNRELAFGYIETIDETTPLSEQKPDTKKLYTELKRYTPEQQKENFKQALKELDEHKGFAINDPETATLQGLRGRMLYPFTEGNRADPTITGDPEEIVLATEVVYRAIYKAVIDKKIRENQEVRKANVFDGLTYQQIACYVPNLKRGFIAADKLYSWNKRELLKGLALMFVGALVVAAAVIALVGTFGSSSVVSAPLAMAGMYLMMAGIVATPFMAAAEAKGSSTKKVLGFILGLLPSVSPGSAMAVAVGTESSIQTAKVIAAGGSAVHLTAGASTAAVGATVGAFVGGGGSGAALFVWGGHKVWNAQPNALNKEVSQKSTALFEADKMSVHTRACHM